jgi:hypothetical protein
MLNPASLNLRIVTGIIFGPIILRARDVNDAPVDLTGWKVFAEVRKKPGASLVLDLKPSFTNAALGEITIPKMTDEETYDLRFGTFQWSLVLEDPTGDRRGPYIEGAFTIGGTPTKPLEGI